MASMDSSLGHCCSVVSGYSSFYSLRRFFFNISADWTLLTFGIFGFIPLLIAMIFDEMDRLYSLYFMIVLTLLAYSGDVDRVFRNDADHQSGERWLDRKS